MKKNVLMILSCLAMFGMMSCNNQPEKQDKKDASSANVEFPKDGMRIVYIDVDSLTREYNFAKDNAVLLEKARQELEDAGLEAQKVKDNIEYKYSKNMYTSQAQFEQDQTRLQRLASAYESKLKDAQALEANYYKTLQDSLSSYLKIYQAEKGYDLIINSSVLMEVNPKYDVTHDVAVGLNNRYKKEEPAKEEQK